MSYKPSQEILNKIGAIDGQRLITIRGLRDQLCQNISDENNLEQVKAIATELGMPSEGKKKKDLCQEISDALVYEQTQYAANLYNSPVYDDQTGGKRRKQSHRY